jgi:hypothetical protein
MLSRKRNDRQETDDYRNGPIGGDPDRFRRSFRLAETIAESACQDFHARRPSVKWADWREVSLD